MCDRINKAVKGPWSETEEVAELVDGGYRGLVAYARMKKMWRSLENNGGV